MIKVDNIEVFNVEGAIRGMRNPLNSWDKSDSRYIAEVGQDIQVEEKTFSSLNFQYKIGEKDLVLARKLISGGPMHSKFMRQIFISMDITSGLFWWKEMDQYRISCTTNSCSTMHKLASTPITRDCFSFSEELNDLKTSDNKYELKFSSTKIFRDKR